MDKINIPQIKERIHLAATDEFESLNRINVRAGKFPFYLAVQIINELIAEKKIESYPFGKRIKYKKATPSLVT
jgi:hypothetical protein